MSLKKNVMFIFLLSIYLFLQSLATLLKTPDSCIQTWLTCLRLDISNIFRVFGPFWCDKIRVFLFMHSHCVSLIYLILNIHTGLRSGGCSSRFSNIKSFSWNNIEILALTHLAFSSDASNWVICLFTEQPLNAYFLCLIYCTILSKIQMLYCMKILGGLLSISGNNNQSIFKVM